MIKSQFNPNGYSNRFDDSNLFLMIITDASAASSPPYCWNYTVKRAKIDATTYLATAVAGAPAFSAISISEIGNHTGNYSFGVPAADIPAGFAPKQIPVDTPVICTSCRLSDGTFKYLIINTQAISGTC